MIKRLSVLSEQNITVPLHLTTPLFDKILINLEELKKLFPKPKRTLLPTFKKNAELVKIWDCLGESSNQLKEAYLRSLSFEEPNPYEDEGV